MDQQAIRRYADIQGSTARDYYMGSQDEHTSYYTDLQQLTTNAENQWRKVYDTYLQELRAASAGDDVAQRANAAYRNLQREYVQIQNEYSKACQDRFARMSETLGKLSTEARTKSVDTWIDLLREVRQAVAAQHSTSKSGDA